jgi:hypothetical protein
MFAKKYSLLSEKFRRVPPRKAVSQCAIRRSPNMSTAESFFFGAPSNVFSKLATPISAAKKA